MPTRAIDAQTQLLGNCRSYAHLGKHASLPCLLYSPAIVFQSASALRACVIRTPIFLALPCSLHTITPSIPRHLQVVEVEEGGPRRLLEARQHVGGVARGHPPVEPQPRGDHVQRPQLHDGAEVGLQGHGAGGGGHGGGEVGAGPGASGQVQGRDIDDAQVGLKGAGCRLSVRAGERGQRAGAGSGAKARCGYVGRGCRDQLAPVLGSVWVTRRRLVHRVRSNSQGTSLVASLCSAYRWGMRNHNRKDA